MRVRFVRPDGTTAVDDAAPASFHRWRQTWGTWRYAVDLDRAGTWRLLVDLDGRTLVDAPFDVTAGTARNRPPNAIAASLTRLAGGVALCTVTQDLVREDPDYDIVRYRYVWTAGGRVIRAVTSAGLRDALPRTAPRNTACAVTPGDGRVAGPTARAVG